MLRYHKMKLYFRKQSIQRYARGYLPDFWELARSKLDGTHDDGKIVEHRDEYRFLHFHNSFLIHS